MDYSIANEESKTENNMPLMQGGEGREYNKEKKKPEFLPNLKKFQKIIQTQNSEQSQPENAQPTNQRVPNIEGDVKAMEEGWKGWQIALAVLGGLAAVVIVGGVAIVLLL